MLQLPAWSGGPQEEYQTQLFGFGAQRFKIAVRQMVEEKIRSGVKYMEASLQEMLDLNETDKATLSHSCDKLLRMYCDRAGPSLDAIDREIERTLEVPPNVVLPEDEVQLEQCSDKEHEELKEEVADLRKRVERGALMLALLTAEEEEIASVEKVCENAKKDMESLELIHKDFEGINVLKAVHSEAEFLCASVPFMQKSNYEFGFGDDDNCEEK